RVLVTSASAAMLMALVSLGVLAATLSAGNRRERLAKDQARENFDLARDTVEKYCIQVSNNLRLRVEDLHDLRTELLQTAVQFYETFRDQPGNDSQIRWDRAKAYAQLGYLQIEMSATKEGIENYERANSLYRQLVSEQGSTA